MRCNRRLVIGAAVRIRSQRMGAIGIVVAGIIGRTCRGQAPYWVVQGLLRISDLRLSIEFVVETKTFRPPGSLWNDLIIHQPFEHASSPARYEVNPAVGIMALEDGELLSRLRIGVCLVIALRRLSLPGVIGGQRPPGAPPHITGHLMHPHSNVGSDTRLRVE